MAVDKKSLGIPASARPKNDPRLIDGLAGLEAAHGALQEGIDSIYKLPYELTSGMALKNFDLPTIGSQMFDGNDSAVKFIKQFDPSNQSGAVSFGLNIANKIKSELDGGKLFSDLMGPKIAALVGLSNEIKNLIPSLSLHFPDLAGVLNSKLQEIQNQMTSSLDELTKPIENIITSVDDASKKVNELVEKIESIK